MNRCNLFKKEKLRLEIKKENLAERELTESSVKEVF